MAKREEVEDASFVWLIKFVVRRLCIEWPRTNVLFHSVDNVSEYQNKLKFEKKLVRRTEEVQFLANGASQAK